MKLLFLILILFSFMGISYGNVVCIQNLSKTNLYWKTKNTAFTHGHNLGSIPAKSGKGYGWTSYCHEQNDQACRSYHVKTSGQANDVVLFHSAPNWNNGVMPGFCGEGVATDANHNAALIHDGGAAVVQITDN